MNARSWKDQDCLRHDDRNVALVFAGTRSNYRQIAAWQQVSRSL